MSKQKTVTLENIKQGAINDLFLNELETVLDNIMDINTPWKQQRHITVKVSLFARDENRDVIGCVISCEPKLAAANPIFTTLSIGHERVGDKMRPVAYEMEGTNRNQLSMLTVDDVVNKKTEGDQE